VSATVKLDPELVAELRAAAPGIAAMTPEQWTEHDARVAARRDADAVRAAEAEERIAARRRRERERRCPRCGERDVVVEPRRDVDGEAQS